MDRITTTLEFFTGINMIRAFNNQDFEEQRTNQTFKNYAERMSKVNQIFAWITPVAFLLMGVVYASILWFGGNLVAIGTLQIGTVTAVIEYTLLTFNDRGYGISCHSTVRCFLESLARSFVRRN